MSSKVVNILLLEDDEIDARSILRAFKRKRIANPVTVEVDGVDGLARLRGTGGRERLEKPYIILLDLNMPRMDGLHFLDELRVDPDLRSSVVFVLTTSTLDRDRIAAYEKQVAGYIVKERAGDDFVRLLDLLGHYWQVVELPEQ